MKRKYIAYSLLLLASAFSSCKKDFLDQSNNPNQPTTGPASVVLTGALVTTARNINTSFTLEGYLMGYWSPAAGYAPSNSLLTYQFTTADYQVFSQFYLNLANYDYIIKQSGTDPAQVYFSAISQIMEAYNFQALVDNYNNIPYSEAFQGAKNLTPKYENGKDIYAKLITKLDDAITAIKNASTSVAVKPGNADVMFAGDMTKWVQFANTLKLRLVLRQVPNVIDAAAAKTLMANHLSEGFLTTMANVNPGYVNVDGKQSPFWGSYGLSQSGSNNAAPITANVFATDFYTNTADDRGPAFYAPVGGKLVGNTFGTLVPITASAIGRSDLYGSNASNKYGLLKTPSMDAVIMSASESYFLQAEAAARGVISGSAATLYNSGITASFEYVLQTTDADAKASDYAAQASVAYPSGSGATLAQQIQAIITQKWASLNGYGNLEAYNEYRRTGIPKVPVSIYTGVTVKNIPRRILYPASEYAQNASNVQAQGSINQFTSNIFWAQQITSN
ncbi:SusD/RagB family nutrient-binding outer membrane lipoprotein [Mucilaginibacter rubeus]|uniref:SusD/RagB family nutrient-binding outer membrane lipoprotein n=1 Tax=Mucilaginibacter rubeus TaxID=2027860 RepID=A0A5C1I7Q5_9SPHI|nr:SusD/RagB family nutrient-binding outer membrane lipoprotein [Mucilaginibacter rubeus]QEM13588.1 SusD/RagB family nutrient-binding outer membrane lipoprotein [Mucilaginibacter rubeus]